MPDVVQWESYFDSDEIVHKLSDPGRRRRCVEFGCGFGTFTRAAASLVDVKQIASFDIDDDMIRTTQMRLSDETSAEVFLTRRDFLADGCGLPDGWADWAMIFNLLHIESPSVLLAEAHRVIRRGGTLALIHWRDDVATPRGPSMNIRPSLTQCQAWAEQVGFQFASTPVLEGSPWHWGLRMTRLDAETRRDSEEPQV
ncbi:class I SAM-dependent methyltransferase [Rosistilla oblonga]|uniref:class I SAM-dependent methyltransferase n=2 Tax=Planctomycetia TaxID=203683 RepID=UPI003A977A65